MNKLEYYYKLRCANEVYKQHMREKKELKPQEMTNTEFIVIMSALVLFLTILLINGGWF